MPAPLNPSHAAEYLAALATQLITGTAIATVLIQKGLQPATAAFPVLILNVPTTRRVRKANHLKQSLFEVHGVVLDRYATDTTRTLEQILADLATLLETLADNVDLDPTLGLGPTLAGEEMTIRVDGPVDDKELGVPLVVGEIVIQVKSPWYASSA